jgi:dTDP-glucose 4,6-dehydratase
MGERKNILVTGGAGFIGANFIYRAMASRNSWSISNLDALTYAGNIHNLDSLPSEQKPRYRFIQGDIRDDVLLKGLLDLEPFDGIVHFAAESHVDRSILGPSAFLETNVVGTFRLLDAALRHWKNQGKPEGFRYLHVSTDEVYGSLGSDGRFTEQTAYDPSSPYSASKAASDHFVKAYQRTYGLPTIVTNCSNNFGPYQFPEKLIPLVVMNIVEEKPIPIYGDGKNIRDWLYVIDHCDALIKVFEQGRVGHTYNIGGGAEKENIQIVELLCKILDKRLGRFGKDSSKKLITYVADRPGHDKRYAIDSGKIKGELGWVPRCRFEEALEQTVEWYLTHLEWIESVRTGEYRKWIDTNYVERSRSIS